MREVAGHAVKMYSDADTIYRAKPDSESAKKMVLETGALMKDFLFDVQKMCDSAARIEASSKDKLSITFLGHFIKQVLMCAYEAFEGKVDQSILDDFEERLKTQIRLPDYIQAKGGDGTPVGTEITPDQDVMDMDATIPKE